MADQHAIEQARVTFSWQALAEPLLAVLGDAGCAVEVEGDGARIACM